MVIAQYTDFFSLFIFTLLLIPAIILGLLGKRIKYYSIIVSIPALILIMGLQTKQMLQFLVFIVCETILVMSYYYFHKKVKSEFIYYSVFLFSIVPIFIIKACVYFPKFSFLGFIGISYLSFRIWQLIIEIHDGHIEKLSIIEMLYFITFFPAISSGPIDCYARFEDELNKKISAGEYASEYFFLGIKKILLGIVYKFGIAALIHFYIIEKLPTDKTFLSVIIYMYAYTFYLFFDFAGYSNFAIGTSHLLGIKTPENFNKPFLARNMKEFWDRWHMSLSKWFGDYLFSRFVLNTLRNGTFKSKKVAIRCGYMLTMTVMGLWHGFYVFYIAYGLYQGAMLVLTDVYLKSKIYKKFKQSKCYDILSIIVCFQAIAFGMLIFSGYLFKF